MNSALFGENFLDKKRVLSHYDTVRSAEIVTLMKMLIVSLVVRLPFESIHMLNNLEHQFSHKLSAT